MIRGSSTGPGPMRTTSHFIGIRAASRQAAYSRLQPPSPSDQRFGVTSIGGATAPTSTSIATTSSIAPTSPTALGVTILGIAATFPTATPGLPSVSAMPIAPLLEKPIAAKRKPGAVTWARQTLAKPVRPRSPRRPLPLLVPQPARLAQLQRPSRRRPLGQNKRVADRPRPHGRSKELQDNPPGPSKPQQDQNPRRLAATPGALPARQGRRRGRGQRTGHAPARSDRRCEAIDRRVVAVVCAPVAGRGSACVAAALEAVVVVGAVGASVGVP